MPLAIRQVNPRYSGPIMQQYQARGAGGGYTPPSPGQIPQQDQQQKQQQINPVAMRSLLQMLGDSSGEMGVNFGSGTTPEMVMGEGWGTGAPVTPSWASGGLMEGLGHAPLNVAGDMGGTFGSGLTEGMALGEGWGTGAGLASEGAASSGGGFMSSLGSGASSLMSNPWTAILAAAAALSAGSVSKGHDKMGQNWGEAAKSTFGGEGWGGPPMMMFQKAFDGDWKGASRELGGTDPGGIVNPIFTLAGGGDLEDVGKNMIAPVFNMKDIGKGSNPWLDIINVFSSPGMARK